MSSGCYHPLRLTSSAGNLQSIDTHKWLHTLISGWKMAAKGSSFGPATRRRLKGLTSALRSAACEWLLIFLLLLDAVFAYLLTKFASYCNLQVPCILCSRLDHILGHEKPGFYRDLICTSHRVELSCLMFCQDHNKLADGRSMCDECLLSFSANSDKNMQRVAVGKLGFDLGSNYLLPGSVATKLCSCCRMPWRSRQRADRILKLKSPRSSVSPKPPLPHRLNQQESLRKIREKYSGSLTPCRFGSRGFDSLSHVGYTELKFNSDSESEFQYSDDDEYHNFNRELEELRHKEVHDPTDVNASDQTDREAVKDESIKLSPRGIPELITSNLTEKKKSEQNNPSVLNSDPSVLSELMAMVDSPSSFKASKGSDGIVTFNDARNEALKLMANTSADGTTQVDHDLPSTTEVASSEHERVDEDLKPSSSRDIDAASKNNFESRESEPKVSLDSSPRSPVSKEKVDHKSNVEPALDLIVGEIEGESIEERLRRQIEHDRIVISTLTKELEEERSASSIAANQTMAMITRLQAEKAALHMEALQYLRMMEEQAEYDGEELEKVNDILAEREKELQDLEAELEYFRLQYPYDEEEEEGTVGSSIPNNTAMSSTTSRDEKGDNFAKSSWPDIEEEKSFIFQRLKSLERKLQKLSRCSASPYMSDSEYSDETADRGGGIIDTGEFLLGNNEIRNGQRAPNPQHEAAEFGTLKNEISDLNERLEALETDWSFLEHAFNSLESGTGGLQFVQDIAHRLQELRKLGFRSSSRYQPVPS